MARTAIAPFRFETVRMTARKIAVKIALDDERADVGDAGSRLGDAVGHGLLADGQHDDDGRGDGADDLGDDVADAFDRRSCGGRAPSRPSRPG